MILTEEDYKGATRVIVKGVKPDAEAAKYESLIKGAILLSIGGENIEGLRLNSVSTVVKNAKRPLSITFRDPRLFFTLLQSKATSNDMSAMSTEGTQIITSVIRPATKGNAAEMLTVEILRVSTLSATVTIHYYY